MRARSLPLSGCPVATTKVGDGLDWCETCRRHVIDLSAMTEAEARAWLRRGSSERRCVSYRVDADDAIVFAPSRAALVLGPWLALLVACAGHLDARAGAVELACRDAHGYEIECPSAHDDWRIVPDEGPAPDEARSRAPMHAEAERTEDATQGPARAPEGLVGRTPLGPEFADPHRVGGVATRPLTPPSAEAMPVHARATRGVIVVVDHASSEASFWPSSIDDPPTQAEALARAAERRTARRAARTQR